jgi:hypothetical protein
MDPLRLRKVEAYNYELLEIPFSLATRLHPLFAFFNLIVTGMFEGRSKTGIQHPEQPAHACSHNGGEN